MAEFQIKTFSDLSQSLFQSKIFYLVFCVIIPNNLSFAVHSFFRETSHSYHKKIFPQLVKVMSTYSWFDSSQKTTHFWLAIHNRFLPDMLSRLSENSSEWPLSSKNTILVISNLFHEKLHYKLTHPVKLLWTESVVHHQENVN